MEQILEMAKEIGHALQQDERFIKLQMAQAAADNDAALQELIGEFNLKRMAINAEAAKSEAEQDAEKTKQLNVELREVYARVMANESMAAYNAAKTELDKIINGVGAIINMAAQGLNPDDYDEHQCGGNCASCGGCH
ncbi:MAG: YlbF family regulator [Clostridia bacterium]|nr:YlbF family regulator [Clostridia bacterium]